MIRGVIVMNDQGNPRLIKFYEFQPPEKQQELVRSIYRILCSRAENVSNFVKADSLLGPNVRLVYKTFSTLYFVFIFDKSENELAMMDLMQVFVETLNKCFREVCELHVVFNFYKIHMILDEIILGGQVLETSSEEVANAVDAISRLEKNANSMIPSFSGWHR
ncbi:AP-3 complex subunit sigma-like [Salvia divinorum]|uniref:AP complex subunit sigma n=1 Tax=Salvia divinorum TaxID=28513 RepID=A0ABD1HSI1_SALDI